MPPDYSEFTRAIEVTCKTKSQIYRDTGNILLTIEVLLPPDNEQLATFIRQGFDLMMKKISGRLDTKNLN